MSGCLVKYGYFGRGDRVNNDESWCFDDVIGRRCCDEVTYFVFLAAETLKVAPANFVHGILIIMLAS